MSIRDNGGAVRYWRHYPTGKRAVLCANGKILELINGRWLDRALQPAMMNHWNGWQTDTRPSVSAAITRTTRDAMRRGSA